jgi:hypothetical protein
MSLSFHDDLFSLENSSFSYHCKIGLKHIFRWAFNLFKFNYRQTTIGFEQGLKMPIIAQLGFGRESIKSAFYKLHLQFYYVRVLVSIADQTSLKVSIIASAIVISAGASL